MKAKLLPFPHSPDKIPTPLPTHHQRGDDYLRVDLTDDALKYVGLFAGACFIILRGALWDGLPHALEFNGEVYLGVLRYIDQTTVEFFSWHDRAYSGVYAVKSLCIIGAMAEVFPFGDDGPRWILSPNKKENSYDHNHAALLKASAK
jgi:hypothetical protein